MTHPTCEPRKRTYSPSGFARDLLSNAATLPGLASAYVVPGRIDPALREKVMLGITRVNRCRHCAAIHGLWGERAGVSPPELEGLLGGEPAALEGGEREIVELACAAATGQGAVAPDEAADALRSRLGARRAREVVAVARGINLANRLGNTWDAFSDRLRGRDAGDSSLVGELMVLGAVAPVGAPFLAVSKTIRLLRGEPEI